MLKARTLGTVRERERERERELYFSEIKYGMFSIYILDIDSSKPI